MRKHLVLKSLPWLLIVLAPAGCTTSKVQSQPQPQPTDVLFAEAVQRDLPIYVNAIGQTKGSREVQITPRVSGFVQTQEYKDGAIVKQGQLLYTLDPKPFLAALAQAQGQLAQAQAIHEQAKNDVTRYQPLAGEDAISKQQLENAVTNERAAAAAVEAAKANVESAQINLGYTKIYSPVTGLASISNVAVGTLVGNGQNTVLTIVSQVEPIRVRFPISEREYFDYRSRIPNEQEAQNSRPDIHMTIANGETYPYSGQLAASEALVDPSTGTLTLEADFRNPNTLLRPGQYARIQIQSQVMHGAILVPQRAVQEIQGTYSVAVIGPDGKINIRPVRLGPQVGASWIVDNGLKAGERVVVEGVQKLRNGAVVNAKAAAASAESAGSPAGLAETRRSSN